MGLKVNVLKFRSLDACQKGLDKVTIRVDSDQNASEEAVWSGTSLFAILILHFVNSRLENQYFI